MMTTDLTDINDLVERLARLSAADNWAEALSLPQRAALSYLSRANRVSLSLPCGGLYGGDAGHGITDAQIIGAQKYDQSAALGI